MDVGSDEVVSRPGQPVIDAARERGVQLLPTVHGLHVYEQFGTDSHMFGRAELQVQTQIKALFNSELEGAKGRATDDTATALACDLFCSVDFETSRRARFVALITAVEALATDRCQINPALQGIIDTYLAALQEPPDGVDQAEFDSFGTALLS